MKHIFTILLSIILLGTSPMCALAQEAYAIVSPNDTTLTFYPKSVIRMAIFVVVFITV